MLRTDFEVFFLGTAIVLTHQKNKSGTSRPNAVFLRESGGNAREKEWKRDN
jgi:hypothetical protein